MDRRDYLHGGSAAHSAYSEDDADDDDDDDDNDDDDDDDDDKGGRSKDLNDGDDDDDDGEEDEEVMAVARVKGMAAMQTYNSFDDDDDDEKEEEEDNDAAVAPPAPRGKPEAMAYKLAAKQMSTHRKKDITAATATAAATSKTKTKVKIMAPDNRKQDAQKNKVNSSKSHSKIAASASGTTTTAPSKFKATKSSSTATSQAAAAAVGRSGKKSTKSAGAKSSSSSNNNNSETKTTKSKKSTSNTTAAAGAVVAAAGATSTHKKTKNKLTSSSTSSAVAAAISDQGGTKSSKSSSTTTAAATTTVTTKIMSSFKGGSGGGSSSYSAVSASRRLELFLNESAPSISKEQYDNLEKLMIQFCRVPLLSEFSRPVSLLHPELMGAYSKIVAHPVDLGHICRGIRRRQYRNTRDIRLDMWRVFANCVKFHSHSNNKEAVPSFVSIALHLREFFNNLWHEFMLPSELPDDATNVMRNAFRKREDDRRKRLENSGVLNLAEVYMKKLAVCVGHFVDNQGCADALDKVPLFTPDAVATNRELAAVLQNLRRYQERLSHMKEDSNFNLGQAFRELEDCYSRDVFEDNPALRNRIALRAQRAMWKKAVPLHEANTRGVTQSSIWGNIAATIWARESSKKPYWPALCLGILPPEDQRETWHDAVTERNELRLPEKLRAQLMLSKKRCEQAQKRQSLSYFLVEFLGTHEFIWVRELDIVEQFDPNEDPNKSSSHVAKRKRSSRSGTSSTVGSPTYAVALEECVWAHEEYETVLNDAFEYSSDDEDEAEGDEMNYSYSVLAQSDDEADDEASHGFQYDETSMSLSDVDEANWLLSHEGMLDTTAEGRKNAKKRTQALKKQITEKEKKKEQIELIKKQKIEVAKEVKKKSFKEKKTQEKPSASIEKSKIKSKEEKERELEEKAKAREEKKEEKKEKRDLEKRRKKRLREREKYIRSEARKNKRRRTATEFYEDYDDEHERGLASDKQRRSTAIVKAYLTRLAKRDDCRALALGGVMTMPSAMVDSTGLLGMALAFRAAAGELAMPDEGENKAKPWDMINTERPRTSYERTENLERKIALLQEEIRKVRMDTEKRRRLADEAAQVTMMEEQRVQADDVLARRNHFKKKKKSLLINKAPDNDAKAGTGSDAASVAATDPAPDDHPSAADVDDQLEDDAGLDDEEEEEEDEDEEDDEGDGVVGAIEADDPSNDGEEDDDDGDGTGDD